MNSNRWRLPGWGQLTVGRCASQMKSNSLRWSKGRVPGRAEIDHEPALRGLRPVMAMSRLVRITLRPPSAAMRWGIPRGLGRAVDESGLGAPVVGACALGMGHLDAVAVLRDPMTATSTDRDRVALLKSCLQSCLEFGWYRKLAFSQSSGVLGSWNCPLTLPSARIQRTGRSLIVAA